MYGKKAIVIPNELPLSVRAAFPKRRTRKAREFRKNNEDKGRKNPMGDHIN
jgi:hypothetical protein